MHTLCHPHPEALLPTSSQPKPPREGFPRRDCDSRERKRRRAPGALGVIECPCGGDCGFTRQHNSQGGLGCKAGKPRSPQEPATPPPTYPRRMSCCPRLRTRLAATAPSSRYSGAAKPPSEPATAGRTCCGGGWGRSILGARGWGWPPVPCAQSATQPSHTKQGWRHKRRRLPIAGAKSARIVARRERTSEDKIRTAGGEKKSQGLSSPSSARWTPLGRGVLVERCAASVPDRRRAGRGLLAQGAARHRGKAAGSPARSTLHPPGHCPERLQDRRRVGAGNYKSNPSSGGIKLQRKRTSQGGKKKGGRCRG